MTPEPSPATRKFPVDPAWVALIVASLVLLLAISWLMGGRAPPRLAQVPVVVAPVVVAPVVVAPVVAAPVAVTPDPTDTRLAALETALQRLGERPAGDPEALAALARQVASNRQAAEQALDTRLSALEAAAQARLTTALAAQGERLAALEAAVTARLNQAVATREAAEQVLASGLAARLTEATAARETAEQALASRVAALDQARATGEASLGQRLTNLETSQLQRQATLEATTTQRLAAMELAATQRLAPLEQALQRLTAAEARTERLAGIEALRALLDAGQPLGPALPRLGSAPPPALARFTTTAPPTEPALRLGFEDALRQARGTAQEGVLPRLNSLLTIRRGDDVVWGDATEAHVERARRALDAGDVAGALVHLARLPEPTRQALRGWTEEAQALAEARSALRGLAGG